MTVGPEFRLFGLTTFMFFSDEMLDFQLTF